STDTPAEQRKIDGLKQHHGRIAHAGHGPGRCPAEFAQRSGQAFQTGAPATSGIDSTSATIGNTRSRRASSRTARTESLTATRAKAEPLLRAFWNPSTSAAIPDESI